MFEGNEKLEQLQNKLVDTYGTNNINVQNGIINYPKDESSNS
jgi:hypothetical protein